ncbi:MAG TPA: F0F1 ATP synthase subunit A [Streptosporangiaceae bacterium]|nr:F0F1 ATP synthase subunit A [Streptosporangiaceae bacterium]
MTVGSQAIAIGGCHLKSGCGFPAPGLFSFLYPPIFSIGSFHFTKPMLLILICAALVIWFFWAAFAKPKLVPRGIQNVAELGVFFVRDQILRPMMGKEGDGYLPFLVSLFFFIWIANLMEIIPFAQFPPMSRVAFPVALTLMVYGIYNVVGIRRQGLVGYFRNMIPSGVPWWVLPILAPVEIAQHIIIRPFTLAIRLFANMFAGHILISVFTLASWYLFGLGIQLLFSATSFILVIVLTGFEMLIQTLQAYIFTILAAQYIGGALEPEH